ncbi:MAG: hypothetical protein HZB38_07745 [Planctomycetes bacterium]|nr:hypothetical protein [Planctomycetota bacterium]
MEASKAKSRPLARALETPRATSGGPVDAEDRIVADILCVNCGAKIRGQYLADNCYECNHPNTDSVYGDLLVYNDDKTVVTRLHESASVVIYSAAFTGIVGLVVMLMPMMNANNAIDVIHRAFEGIKFAVLIFPLVAFVGILLLTRHGTLKYLEQKYTNIAFLIRAAVYLLIFISVIMLASRRVGSYMRVAAFLVWTMAQPILFLRGLYSLLRRVPNLPLAAWCNFLIAGIGLLGIGGTAVHYLDRLVPNDPTWEGPVTALKVIVVLCCMGWAAGVFAVLRATRRTLQIINM